MEKNLTKQELGEHLFRMIKERSESLLADYNDNKLPLSRSAIYNLKSGQFNETTLQTVADYLQIKIETLYRISNPNQNENK
ncbi:hypothetical protein [Xanthocytophaga agilis]|uniref:Uncharacterized protein n=1 Tax=Xanthocytophaga agilis TaxID=3048010 RepID=A0AAE3UC75_9BACT|nr:hypothetical protein [Xanthocytophaga agilis]MDJ1500638.1 hypothetical protein [Xanthocytophaga agilis]